MRISSIGLCLGLAAAVPAWGQASFYEGKTVTVVIGASGGSLEIASRIVARHLGKHLPGNPNVIVQNMTGAAHLVATNHVTSWRPTTSTTWRSRTV
jgi:tripartite-type tricarboxylate transporter receptor subunit TctC